MRVWIFIYTSEILYWASGQLINEKKQETYAKELSIVDISYLSGELSRFMILILIMQIDDR